MTKRKETAKRLTKGRVELRNDNFLMCTILQRTMMGWLHWKVLCGKKCRNFGKIFEMCTKFLLEIPNVSTIREIQEQVGWNI
jgi:hypothetical protein